MINIIEDKLHRRIKLIDLLIEYPTGISLDEISIELDVSKSTIQRDIDLLNNTYDNSLHIETDLNKLFLKNSNSEELMYIKYLLLNESINLKVLSGLFVK